MVQASAQLGDLQGHSLSLRLPGLTGSSLPSSVSSPQAVPTPPRQFSLSSSLPWPLWTPSSSFLPAQQGPSLCEHGGSCLNTPGSFNCLCPPGYTGSRCEADHNECLSQPCHPGSTCLDLLATFHCLCPPGTAGRGRGQESQRNPRGIPWSDWPQFLQQASFSRYVPTRAEVPTTPRRAGRHVMRQGRVPTHFLGCTSWSTVHRGPARGDRTVLHLPLCLLCLRQPGTPLNRSLPTKRGSVSLEIPHGWCAGAGPGCLHTLPQCRVYQRGKRRTVHFVSPLIV